MRTLYFMGNLWYTARMETIDTYTPATSLGFVLPPSKAPQEPPAGEKSLLLAELEFANTLAPDARVAFYEELIRQNSLYAVREIQADLAVIAASPTTTVSQKLQIAEFQAKLAKLDKKQVDNAATGPSFSIQINIPGAPSSSVTVDSVAQVVSDE